MWARRGRPARPSSTRWTRRSATGVRLVLVAGPDPSAGRDLAVVTAHSLAMLRMPREGTATGGQESLVRLLNSSLPFVGSPQLAYVIGSAVVQSGPPVLVRRWFAYMDDPAASPQRALLGGAVTMVRAKELLSWLGGRGPRRCRRRRSPLRRATRSPAARPCPRLVHVGPGRRRRCHQGLPDSIPVLPARTGHDPLRSAAGAGGARPLRVAARPRRSRPRLVAHHGGRDRHPRRDPDLRRLAFLPHLPAARSLRRVRDAHTSGLMATLMLEGDDVDHLAAWTDALCASDPVTSLRRLDAALLAGPSEDPILTAQMKLTSGLMQHQLGSEEVARFSLTQAVSEFERRGAHAGSCWRRRDWTPGSGVRTPARRRRWSSTTQLRSRCSRTAISRCPRWSVRRRLRSSRWHRASCRRTRSGC